EQAPNPSQAHDMSISRRNFLRGLGLATASVPFFPLLSSAQETFPKRLVVFFSANGTIHEEWAPSGGETDFQLKQILAPLEDHRSSLTIVAKHETSRARSCPGDDHQQRMGHVLAGVPLPEGNEFPGCGGDRPGSGWGGGISVDQLIANAIGGATRF